jgi:hypothetical protein
MEQLPYIDEHAISVCADRTRTWRALLSVVCRDPGDISTVPIGFVLDSVTTDKRLALKGRHLFAIYRLVFELDEKEGPPRTLLRAMTWSRFPGIAGRAYRALVISSGAHRLLVQWMLRRIAAVAAAS